MYLTLVKIASDLSSFTVKATAELAAVLANRLIIRYKTYGGTYTNILLIASGDANWAALFGDGVTIPKKASDGVHLFEVLVGLDKVVNVDATGNVEGDPGLTDYLSLQAEPYTLFTIRNRVVDTLHDLNAAALIQWTSEESGVLVIYSAEKALAADIRAKATLGCVGLEGLMPRYMDLQSAIMRFNCRDYKGADWLVNNSSLDDQNCGCS